MRSGVVFIVLFLVGCLGGSGASTPVKEISTQTISFDALPVLTVGASSVISATSSSNLPVSFEVNTTLTCAAQGCPTPPQPACSITGNVVTALSIGTCSIVATQAGSANSSAVQATQELVIASVKIQTAKGVIGIELFDTAAPLTVANFLSYVNSGAYNNSIIHRSMPGFIIQGGGFTNSLGAISATAPVVNEFSADRSNVRGTIAMAKFAGDPNSATNQWFINLTDNSASLDGQNGGFTVFGRVVGNGMQVAEAIAALSVVNAGILNGAFTNLPLLNPLAINQQLSLSDLVAVSISK